MLIRTYLTDSLLINKPGSLFQFRNYVNILDMRNKHKSSSTFEDSNHCISSKLTNFLSILKTWVHYILADAYISMSKK